MLAGVIIGLVCLNTIAAQNCKQQLTDFKNCSAALTNKTGQAFGTTDQSKKRNQTDDQIVQCFKQYGCSADAYSETEKTAVRKCVSDAAKALRDSFKTCMNSNGNTDFDSAENTNSEPEHIGGNNLQRAMERCKAEKNVSSSQLASCISKKTTPSGTDSLASRLAAFNSLVNGLSIFSLTGGVNLASANTLYTQFCAANQACNAKFTATCKTTYCTCLTQSQSQVDARQVLANCLQQENVQVDDADITDLSRPLTTVPNYCSGNERDICNASSLQNLFLGNLKTGK